MGVEVADDLRISGGVPRVGDPGVAAPEAVLGDAGSQVAGDAPVLHGDDPVAFLAGQGRLDLSTCVRELRQERLGIPVARVALRQERRRRLDVLRGERAQLEATPRRRPRPSRAP
jgi:hypothetical protein